MSPRKSNDPQLARLEDMITSLAQNISNYEGNLQKFAERQTKFEEKVTSLLSWMEDTEHKLRGNEKPGLIQISNNNSSEIGRIKETLKGFEGIEGRIADLVSREIKEERERTKLEIMVSAGADVLANTIDKIVEAKLERYDTRPGGFVDLMRGIVIPVIASVISMIAIAVVTYAFVTAGK